MRLMRLMRLLPLLPFALAAAACELAEVAAPAGDDVLIVEAVLRAGTSHQYVLLHRAMSGRRVGGEPGASVVVTGDDHREYPYTETELGTCLVGNHQEWSIEDLEIDATCYISRTEDRFVRPGAEYELRIETARGEVVRGRTRVPAGFRFHSPALAMGMPDLVASCVLPAREFPLVWSRAEGAWAYIVSMSLHNWGEELRQQGVEVPSPLELTGVSVSAADTTLLFPTEIGLFQRAEYDQRIFFALREGIPETASAFVTVLAADRNYTNAIRGGRFNPSGNLRSSSVVGDGVGVFGSIVPLTIRSFHSPDTERCPA